MSSFTDTDSLKEDSFECLESKEREWWIEMLLRDLKMVREQKDEMDVDSYVEDIRFWAKSRSLSFADLGTSEEELAQLVQTGYESEARTCLELARDTLLCLYMRGVKNVGQCFFKEPNFHQFKWFLTTVFCPWMWCHTRQYYIVRARGYLAKLGK